MSAKVLRHPAGRRPPEVAFWEPLWPELCRAELPSPAQEKVIAELVQEIDFCLRRLKRPPIRRRAEWLRGFVQQASEELWPPDHPQDYNKILYLLKECKTRLEEQERRDRTRVSTSQIKHVRWLLAHDPYRDEEWLYDYIAANFPQARREKGGKMQPSLSSLTSSEASHLIDLLKGQAPARRRRRRRA